ncbi:MAG: M1 family metallopeptidase [Bacteroidia bacterium]|nr:M1 family metallopeptidase [Bacteroidia bacterium]
MKITALLAGIVSIFCLGVQAQTQERNIQIYPEYQRAIQKRTRSVDGMPGEKYFQNRASYSIKGSFLPQTGKLTATCDILYYNDSPDSLDKLVIRLLQNYYRPDSPKDDGISESEYTDGIRFDSLFVNGVPYTDKYIFKESSTNLNLKLKEVLLPKDTISLHIAYHFDVTSGSTQRMGKYQDDAYFIAYWYPQIAVYDDIYGWDEVPYLGMVEFYQSVADFEVEMKIPRKFLMWATGTLKNAEEILTEPFLEKYQRAMLSDTVVKIIARQDYKDGYPITQENEYHSWSYKADNVPDFAFAVSDYYYWDATSISIDSPSRRVLVDACYNPKSRDFRSVTQFARDAIEDLSNEVPGIPYPYPSMTVFNGDLGFGGGMEFPMIVNDGSSFSLGSAFRLTYHEIAHTYFPFLMGINERRHAWMDEGWASYLPSRLTKEKGFDQTPMSSNVATYRRISGTRTHQALMKNSFETRGYGYYVQAYYHPATAYHTLRNVMGDSLFMEALQTYIKRWSNKHPQPYDFFFTFNDVAGEDLSWYWKPWFFETLTPDLAMTDLKVKKKKINCVVENKGGLPIPINLTYVFEDGKQEEERISAAVWRDGNKTYEIQRSFSKKVKKVKLGATDIPDKNKLNN